MSPIKRLIGWGYRLLAVRHGVHLGKNVWIGPGTRTWAPQRLDIHDHVYIGKFCTIEVDGSIGRGTMVGNNVGLIGRLDHDFKQVGLPLRATPWIGDGDAAHPGRKLRIVIGDDCWIGYGSIVLSGVTIGRGAIIGAGSVVIRDVAPYDIVVGSPARVVAQRFTPEQIIEHERLLARRDG